MAIKAFVRIYFVKLFWLLFSCNPFMSYWCSSFATFCVKSVWIAFKVLVRRGGRILILIFAQFVVESFDL